MFTFSCSRGWLHVVSHLKVITPHFEGVYRMVQILPQLQVDLGTVCLSSQPPYAHIFTIAALHLLSEGLDRPVTPFVC